MIKNMMRFDTVLYFSLQFYVRLKDILQFHTFYCTTLYNTMLYYIISYYTIRYRIILYYTILYYTILYYDILYYTTLHYTIPYYAPFIIPHTGKGICASLARTLAFSLFPFLWSYNLSLSLSVSLSISLPLYLSLYFLHLQIGALANVGLATSKGLIGYTVNSTGTLINLCAFKFWCYALSYHIASWNIISSKTIMILTSFI